MRQADALTKEYLSNNEIFADVFNYLIYDGQQRILPDNLIERDTSEKAVLLKNIRIHFMYCLELRINLISITQCLSEICSMMRLIIPHR